MDSLAQDLKYVFRSLARRPGFTAAVLLTLGLGIAANTAIFSVVNGVLLQPLPFESPERLVTPDVMSTKGFYISTSIPNYYDWKDRSRSFESFGAYRGTSARLDGPRPAGGDPRSAGVGRLLYRARSRCCKGPYHNRSGGGTRGRCPRCAQPQLLAGATGGRPRSPRALAVHRRRAIPGHRRDA